MWRPVRPSDEAEAEAVLADCVSAVRKRSYGDLARLAGHVRASYLGGRLRLIDGDRSEFSEAIAPSGARYEVVTVVEWHEEEGGDLEIRIKIQESSDPGGSLETAFVTGRDGSFGIEY
jgi:hypothetical protein